eukprot:TRINITY_DN8634_c0_g1_i1.p1 TRINITY_DN8634_c0_g1~~TRINITY_DN8634_c0_g1_i1.p1  ORF type:complete len:177 (+),score=52.93 TRINITY_DN8634_c0_g1_i1:75-605(+)
MCIRDSIEVVQLHQAKRKRPKHVLVRKKVVLFVDRKNIALSQILSGWASTQGFTALFDSGGTDVDEGQPLTATTRAMLDLVGASDDGVAKKVTLRMIEDATLVLCDSDAARKAVQGLCPYPEERAKVMTVLDRDLDDLDQHEGLGHPEAVLETVKEPIEAKLKEIGVMRRVGWLKS